MSVPSLERKRVLNFASLLAPVREVGDMAAFAGRTIVATPGSLRYFAEVLRQIGTLVVGTTLVLLALEAVIGGECALFFVYLVRPLGAGSFTGFFEVPCGIRELYPYMFGYIFSAKVGCGLVAEIGSMRISNEIDALESMGMDPMRYVIGTRLLAVLIFVPLIYTACIVVGTFGGYLVSVVQIGELTEARFFQGYWASQGLIDNIQSLIKTMSIGTTIALVGMYYGYKARGGPVGVGNAVARSMIVNLIMVHLLGAFWSQVFYSRGANYPFGRMTMATETRIRLISYGALGVAAIVAVVLVIGALSGGRSYTLLAGFDNAIQMTPGQQVRIAGRPVGEISGIKLDKESGMSVVTLKITDGSVWPLPQGTYAVARWGSTTAYLGRYTELIPGPKGNPPLPDGGILTAQQDQSAFELDEAYNIFRGRTAGDATNLLDRLGPSFLGQGPTIRAGLAAAPVGLGPAADVLEQLASNTYDLQTLASAGNRALSALASRADDLGPLVTDAAGTFQTFADHTVAEQQALDRAPDAFTTATSTLARLDTSLNGLTTLVNDLRPGAPALAHLAGVAANALTTLQQIAPQATATLRNGTAAAPPLSKLLATGEQFMPSAAGALGTATPMLSCIRPYGPDIAGFLTTWSGITSHYDAGGHYGRAFELTVIPALYPGTPLNSQQALALSPGLTYAFPRPPGMNDGHPYFIPQCGVTNSALNPADDPEGAGK